MKGHVPIRIRGMMLGTVLLFSFCQLEIIGQEQSTPAQGTSEPSAPASPSVRGPSMEFSPKKFLGDIWSDQKGIWSSPLHMNRCQWFSIALPLSAGTAALLAVDQQAMNVLPNTPGQVKWSGRISNIGVIYAVGTIVGGTMIVGKKKGDSELFQIGVKAGQALVDSLIVNTFLKYGTARERPLENDGQGRFWKGGDSFPSGHTMHAFAMAMVVVRSRRSPAWLKVTSLGVATAVGFSRWSAQRHFPSDIFVGGVLGGLIGNYVAGRVP
jgi:membrane-associated phospholipid phosphatase